MPRMPHEPEPNTPAPNTPQFAPHSVVDPQHQGLVVYTFEYPTEWAAQSRVVWNFGQTSLPVAIYATAFNPQGSQALEFFPTEAFYWLEPNYGNIGVGQNSRGLICMPPMPAPDALVRLVIPKYRGNRQNLRVVSVKPVPDLPKIFNDPTLYQSPLESVVVRIEYEEAGGGGGGGGRTYEEEFYGIHTWNRSPAGSTVQTNWGFARLFCFRAERGQLDAARPTFWHMVGSVRPNPQWQQVYQQVIQQLNGQFQQQVSAFYANLSAQQQISQQNIAYNDQLNQQRSQNVEASIQHQQQLNQERAESHYTTQEAFGDALMGREAYIDPNSATGNYHYEHGYNQYVWTDNQGNFQSAPDPTFDPNINSDRNWVQVPKVDIG